MESDRLVPPVVAVVVTRDPGPWFEETLTALAGQDYPNLAILVIDAGSVEDPTARVAGVLPTAYVRRLDHRVGFGRAANEVIGVVEGASHYLLCHDDVAPDADAVRLLVEEAFRSNAGIVTPKMVDWLDPRRLLSVGAGADKVGVVHSLLEDGELDQEQHDTVRDVFVAPSGLVLVRADLFEALGGFDPAIADHGEDLDLSWRAHVAGARVVVVPSARVRHFEASTTGERPAGRRRSGPGTETSDEHRLRTLVTCYGAVTLAWVLPLAVFFVLGEALTVLVAGRPGDAGRTVASAARAFRRPGQLWRARRRTQRGRRVHDRTVRRLQTPGNARLRAWLREKAEGPGHGLALAVPGTYDSDEDETWARGRPAGPARPRRAYRGGAKATAVIGGGRPDGAPGPPRPSLAALEPLEDAPAGPVRRSWRLPVITAGMLAVILIVGSRNLLTHELPGVASIPDTTGGVGAWWHAWVRTWQPAGLGAIGPSAPALGLLTLAGVIFFGAAGTLQHVLVLGPLVVGPLGAYRLARPWGALRGRVAALVTYALIPLPYDAMARGNWGALIAYAAAPWALAALGRLSDSLPHPSIPVRSAVGRAVALGLLTALTAAVVPSWLLVVPVMAVALAVGSLLVAQSPVALRLLGTGMAAGLVALVLLLPWSAHVVADRSALFGVAPPAAARESFGALLRFDTGPVGSGPLGWGLLVAAGLPLVIGRSWRLAWAARLWVVALTGVAWAWAGLHGLFPAPPAQVVLAMSAAALAGAVALGVVAFEQDLPGYRFGWRQGASALAAAGLAVTAIPFLGAAGSGRWQLPSAGPASALAALDGAPGGDYRVLWVGDPSALPLASSPLGAGQAYATSFDGNPDVTDTWSDGTVGAGGVIAADLRRAEGGLTTNLGHLLAPLGVRFLVIPSEDAPSGSGAAAVPTPGALLAGLRAQTDLSLLELDPDYTVYVNAAWAPVRAVLSPAVAAAASGASSPAAIEQTNLAGSPSALSGAGDDRATGVVAAGSTVFVSASDGPGWRLRVAGRSLSPTPAFGSAMAFSVPATGGGPAVLTAGVSRPERVAQAGGVALWAVAVVVIIVDRRRRTRPGARPETVRPEWFTPLAPTLTANRRSRRRPDRSAGTADDEVWVDA
jgi:GT2 family glycosyltransferase